MTGMNYKKVVRKRIRERAIKFAGEGGTLENVMMRQHSHAKNYL